MPYQPFLFLFLIRYRHSSGEHFKYTIPRRGKFFMILLHSESYTAYSNAQKLPSFCIIYPNICRSANGDLSEKNSLFSFYLIVCSQSLHLECNALSWKVKAQRWGFSQYRQRMLLPAVFSHSSTGYLMVSILSRPRSVLLPAPMLPQTDIIDIFNIYIGSPPKFNLNLGYN